MPVYAGEVHPVKNRLRRFHGHIGLRLDVLAVGGILLATTRLQHGSRGTLSVRKPQPRLAGNGRSIGIDAEFTPDVQSIERIDDPCPQERRRAGRRRKRLDRQPAVRPGSRGIACEDEVGQDLHRTERRSFDFVFKRERHQVPAVPAETAFEEGIAEHQHRIPLQESIGSSRSIRDNRSRNAPHRTGKGETDSRRGGANDLLESGHTRIICAPQSRPAGPGFCWAG